MAGGGGANSELQFEGWQKTFNTYTPRGRLHVAYASAGFWIALGLGIKLYMGRSKPAEPAAK